jgi:hypothetical protein
MFYGEYRNEFKKKCMENIPSLKEKKIVCI